MFIYIRIQNKTQMQWHGILAVYKDLRSKFERPPRNIWCPEIEQVVATENLFRYLCTMAQCVEFHLTRIISPLLVIIVDTRGALLFLFEAFAFLLEESPWPPGVLLVPSAADFLFLASWAVNSAPSPKWTKLHHDNWNQREFYMWSYGGLVQFHCKRLSGFHDTKLCEEAFNQLLHSFIILCMMPSSLTLICECL
jgi:hypothetical protein